MMRTLCLSQFMLPIAGALIAFSMDGIAQGVTTPSAVRENAAPATSLTGTLFFTPQQRERMERLRKSGTGKVDAGDDEPERSTINGFVKRSDGYSAIWIDGQPRFNVQDESVRRLQPADVGGPGNVVRVSSGNTSVVPVAAHTPRQIPARKKVKPGKSSKAAKKSHLQGARKLE